MLKCHQKAATPRLMKRRLAETDRSNGVDNLMRWAAVVIACSCPSMVVRPTLVVLCRFHVGGNCGGGGTHTMRRSHGGGGGDSCDNHLSLTDA